MEKDAKEYSINNKLKGDIRLFVRHDFVAFLGVVLIGLFFIFAPIILITILPGLFPGIFTSKIHAIITIIMSVYFLVLATYIFAEWVNYYYDMLVVIDGFVYDIEQINLFSRHVSEVPLAKIEDVYSEVKGLFPTLFNYGDLIIQTAGAQEKTIVKYIPMPQEVASRIMEFHQQEIKKDREKHKNENDFSTFENQQEIKI